MIYLDYAATAPLRPGVRERLTALLAEPLGNASSLHRQGHKARMVLEEARETIARALHANVEEVVLTSGATEANNLALAGWLRMHERGSRVLIGATEHPSVWDGAHLHGYDTRVMPVDRQGELDLQKAAELLTPDTVLISAMAVNNEIGAIHPIAELVALRDRLAPQAKIHVDAVQSFWLDRPPWLEKGVDMLSVSAHKLGGPVGSGALVLRRRLVLDPLLRGGAQEDGRRAGTSNVLAAVGLAAALEESRDPGRARALRDAFEQRVGSIEGSIRLGGERSPHISSWLFEGIAAEPLLVRLDLAGVAASSGSACSSHSLEPSRTVRAMGFSSEDSRGLIRFSLGYATSADELERAAGALETAVRELRKTRMNR